MPHCGHSATAPWQAARTSRDLSPHRSRSRKRFRRATRSTRCRTRHMAAPLWLPCDGTRTEQGSLSDHDPLGAGNGVRCPREGPVVERDQRADVGKHMPAGRCALVCVFPAGHHTTSSAELLPQKQKQCLEMEWPQLCTSCSSLFTDVSLHVSVPTRTGYA